MDNIPRSKLGNLTNLPKTATISISKSEFPLRGVIMENIVFLRYPSANADYAKDRSLRLRSIGKITFEDSDNRGYGRSDTLFDFCITYVSKGDFEFRLFGPSGGRRFRAEAGDYVFFYPGDAFSDFPVAAGSSRYWLHFSGTTVKEIFNELDIQETQCLKTDINQIPLIEKKFEILLDTARKHPLSDIHINAKLYDLFRTVVPASQYSDNEKIKPAIAYLNTHLKETPDTKMLAEICHLSHGYFIKKFYSVFRQTPHQYIINQKMELAKYLLVSTDEKISKIAENVGYEDVGYFSYAFKKFFGNPPSYFRKSDPANRQ